MLTRPGLSRRQLLMSASSALLYYPLIRALGSAEGFAQSASGPRVIFVSFPSGTYREKFWPSAEGTGAIGTLPIVTSPLEIHKSDMTLFRGFNLVGATNHNGSMPQVLAGWGACSANNDVQCGKNKAFPNNDNTTTTDMELRPYSLDQRLADTIGKNSTRASINMGIHTKVRGNPFPEPISWNSKGNPNFPDDNPKSVYDDLFGKFTVPTGGSSTQNDAAMAVATGKKRIVDYLLGDLKKVKSALGAHEASAFEAHLTALDEINRDLVNAMNTGTSNNNSGNGGSVATSPACDPKTTIGGLFPTKMDNEWYYQTALAPQVFRLQRAIMVQAMACNITRVGVWQMGCSHQESNMPSEGVIDNPSVSLHLQAHSNNETFASNQQGMMREIAKMVTEMKAVSFGNKTLFDETLVYVATDIGDNAAGHGGSNIAAFLLGTLGGKIKAGRQIHEKSGKPYNHLLVTVGQLMGMTDLKTIGNTKAVGPVAAVTA
jgi:hypothetical protein